MANSNIQKQLVCEIRGVLWSLHFDQLWDQLDTRLYGQVDDQGRVQLWNHLGHQVREHLMDQLSEDL